MTEPLDAEARDTLGGGPSFSVANRLERALFAVCWTLFAWVLPPPLGWGWRRFLLRLFGARIEAKAKVYPSAKIWLPRHLRMAAGSTLGPSANCYNMAPISLGAGAIVSQRAFLCAGDHDFRNPSFQLVARPIVLEPQSWVAAEAFVGPGVTLAEGSVLAARGVAAKDLPAWTIWGGNPAAQIGTRDRRATR
ncbi:putative colanic acid biosynthesis acetyltransferase [Erythrobacter litoralis]|uniref:Acetyltransferase n=1 Tax=Erythrobacter litoralis (strain HTCC2594) TaxID=314225 RepID=Q2N708_ERYLH|nr:putative colanic acid biosynthesis acetyltransferase [Erythrobacter litoralis]ABC64533.1 hypothetical protein ELI_12205 [Erythrobacter litoralis HTCC2594]